MQLLENKAEIKKLSKSMAEYIENLEKQATTFISEMNQLIANTELIPGYQVDISKMKRYININEGDKNSFENDGNTRCSGRDWEGYFVFPLFDNEESSDFYYGAVKGSYCAPAVIFCFDNFNQRISDNKISGENFNNINLVVGELIGGVLFDRNSVEKSIRIDYTNNNHKEFAVFNTRAAVKLVYLLQSVVKISNMYKEINSIIKSK